MSQILISAFTDILSAKLFLKFFHVLNVLSDFFVTNLFIRCHLLSGEALMQANRTE